MDDAEYDAYVLARWPALVRAGVGLGCDPEEARDLAQTTLLRCYVAWRKVRKARDRDAYVYRRHDRCRPAVIARGGPRAGLADRSSPSSTRSTTARPGYRLRMPRAGLSSS